MRGTAAPVPIRQAIPVALILSFWLAGALVGARPGRAGTPRASGLAVRGVEAIGMTVGDIDRAVAFYTTVLGFDAVSDQEAVGPEQESASGIFGARVRTVRLRLGAEWLELTEFLAPKGRPFPADLRPNDRLFQHVAIIVRDMDEAYARLRAHGVAHASSGPQRLPDWNRAAAGIRAFYFRDPDGHFLEILQFPPGTGDRRWQSRERLFLGIDHTALVVDDTDRSLAFYRGLLGLGVAGESENRGAEQEQLNGVFGARLRITTLRARSGPGVELLEYLAPRDGRPAPIDLRASDVAHWQTTLAAADPSAAFTHTRTRLFALVSPRAATIPISPTRTATAVLVRDPDGHAVRLVGAADGSR